MLAEMRLARCVGYKAKFFVPAELPDGPGRPIGSHGVNLGARCVTKVTLEIRRIAKRFDKLKRHWGRPAIGILRRHSRLEAIRPVDERPPRHPVQESVAPLVLNEPVEHGARAWQMPAHI